MQLDVRVPPMLKSCTGGRTRFELAATTLDEGLARLVAEHPTLGVHLYDESGALRRHVLIYYNDENIAWLDRLDLPVQPGDRLTVLQAVSGG